MAAIATLALVYTFFPTAGQVVFGSNSGASTGPSSNRAHDYKGGKHNHQANTNGNTKMRTREQDTHNSNSKAPLDMPSTLFDKKLYSKHDFRNDQGIVPSFWSENETCIDDECTKVWGPCYPPPGRVDWNHTVGELGGATEENNKLQYLKQKGGNKVAQGESNTDLANFCRPGFLIIGQGKCGTSSLYHYLVGHPRVLPANQKQIHYFKYYARQGLKWYLSHFPSTRSFLSNGALMTGEASPGYLPYPDVVALTKREMSGTKIICVGRDPLDRAWSSYRYNYVNPALEVMKKGKAPGIERHQPTAYYMKFLHSFEDMMRAELKTLKACLAPGGIGSEGAKHTWGSKKWAKPEYERREAAGLPPLVDLDGQCYGNFVSKESPRKQWEELVAEKPGKFLNVPALHLSQAMIGRSLYVYPLEWWYALFHSNNAETDDDMLYFLCTEEMKDMSGEGIAKVSRFLGLPEYNYSSVVSQGMFNVGGHKGYDKVTSWDTVEEEHEQQEKLEEEAAAAAIANGTTEAVSTSTEEPDLEEGIPLSEEFTRELLDFMKPHNERLFELVGRRCDWAI
jgi:hypothetical protein